MMGVSAPLRRVGRCASIVALWLPVTPVRSEAKGPLETYADTSTSTVHCMQHMYIIAWHIIIVKLTVGMVQWRSDEKQSRLSIRHALSLSHVLTLKRGV